MASAFGIVSPTLPGINVRGMQNYRSLGAFSFLGRYRLIDFPVSNMSNSGIDRVQVYVSTRRPRSLTEHLGSGRFYNINSKKGKLQILFSGSGALNDAYKTDIAAYLDNLSVIKRVSQEYVIIAPNNMIYTQDFGTFLNKHIESGADISLLYHKVDDAKNAYAACEVLKLNKQKGVENIDTNKGDKDSQNIFMNTYVMKKDLLVDLILKGRELSKMYTLAQTVNVMLEELDVRGIQHKGFFAAVTDLESYYKANLSLLEPGKADELFHDDWTIYTRTTDACPTQYYDDAKVQESFVANGGHIDGTIINSIIGRGCTVGKGAVVKNCVISAYAEIGEGAYLENQIVDKWARVIHKNRIVAEEDNVGYIGRDDVL